MPFCLQRKGESLRQALKDYHAKAESKCYVDVSFHMIISDPLPSVLGQELPALVDEQFDVGESGIRVRHEDLKRTVSVEVFSTARETGALVIVHAENHDASRFLTDRLERAGKTAPRYHTTLPLALRALAGKPPPLAAPVHVTAAIFKLMDFAGKVCGPRTNGPYSWGGRGVRKGCIEVDLRGSSNEGNRLRCIAGVGDRSG